MILRVLKLSFLSAVLVLALATSVLVAQFNDGVSFIAAQQTDEVSDLGDPTENYSLKLEEVANPYLVRLWQVPENAVAGYIQYGVELRMANDNSAVGDAAITIYAQPPNDGELQKSPSLNTPSAPEFYQSLVSIDRGGIWELEIRIQRPTEQSVFYDLEVLERVRSGEALVPGEVLYALFVLLLIPMVLVFIWWGAQKRRAKAHRLLASQTESEQENDKTDGSAQSG